MTWPMTGREGYSLVSEEQRRVVTRSIERNPEAVACIEDTRDPSGAPPRLNNSTAPVVQVSAISKQSSSVRSSLKGAEGSNAVLTQCVDTIRCVTIIYEASRRIFVRYRLHDACL
jgi:hypothetical protein